MIFIAKTIKNILIQYFGFLNNTFLWKLGRFLLYSHPRVSLRAFSSLFCPLPSFVPPLIWSLLEPSYVAQLKSLTGLLGFHLGSDSSWILTTFHSKSLNSLYWFIFCLETDQFCLSSSLSWNILPKEVNNGYCTQTLWVI